MEDVFKYRNASNENIFEEFQYNTGFGGGLPNSQESTNTTIDPSLLKAPKPGLNSTPNKSFFDKLTGFLGKTEGVVNQGVSIKDKVLGLFGKKDQPLGGPVIIEKPDYTVYYVIGGLVTVTIVAILMSKNRN